jgi:TRPM family ion channel
MPNDTLSAGRAAAAARVATGCLLAMLVSTLTAMQTNGAPQIIEVKSTDPGASPQLTSLVADVRKQADAFVLLSGGASNMSDEHRTQLMAMFEALALVAKDGHRIAVGDGGTKAGIMEAAGLARRSSGGAFPLIGVAPASEIPPRGTTPVDPHHSHIVAVDNPSAPEKDAWGSETATMYWLFDRLTEGRPAVTVVANGGGITLAEIEANVKAGRRMIVIEGSGRAADALVSLVRQTPPSGEEIARLRDRAEKAKLARRPEMIQIVPLQAGAAGLRDAIVAAVAAKK